MSIQVAVSTAAGGSRGRNRVVALVTGSVVLLTGMAAVYAVMKRNVSTDDAYVQMAHVDVNSNVSGQVVEVAVANNQHVRRGDLLVRLDDRQLRIAVAEARARLESARCEVAAAKAAYLQKRAELDAATERLAYKNRQMLRDEQMQSAGAVSASRLEEAKQTVEEARAEVDSFQQQVAGLLASLGGDAARPLEQYAAVRLARAELERAETTLGFAIVSAPFAGVVARTENVQIGSYVSASKPIFTLFSDRDVWIEANFKEDQLARIRIGQAAEVTLDRFPDKLFHATVVSIDPGTGSAFSVLPPENATGNWVKVTQRVPVKLRFRELPPLDAISAGLSAVVIIRLTGK